MKRLASIAISVAVLILSACTQKTPEGPTEMVMDTTEFSLAAEGGTIELKFIPISSWTALCEESWVSYTPESGDALKEEAVLTIEVSANSGGERTAELVLSFETNDITITINQGGASAPVLEETNFTVPAKGDEIEIEFIAPTAWEATCDKDWISIDPDSGRASKKKKSMYISVDKNETLEKRTAVVVLAFEESQIEITITQEAGEPEPEKPTLKIEQTQFTVSEQGGDINVKFTPHTDWSASTNDSFITLSKTSGKQSDSEVTLAVQVEANDAESKRTATVKLTFADMSVDVTIVQDGAGVKGEIATKEYTAGWKGATLIIEFFAATDWTVVSNSDFVTYTPSKGTAGEEVILTATVAENPLPKKRTAVLSFSFANNDVLVTITQDARPEDTSVTPSQLSVPAEGGTVSFSFVPTTAWSLSSSSSFIAFDKTSGLASSSKVTVNVMVDPNTGSSERKAYVDVEFETNDVRVTISQAAPSGGDTPDPTPDPDDSTGGTEDVNKGDDVTIK